MKKYFINVSLFLFVLAGLFLSSCKEDNPVEPEKTGKIYVTSNPVGAQIWLDGTNTNKVTPDTIVAKEGSREITLKKSGYLDSKFTVNVTANLTSVPSTVSLTNLGKISVQSTPSGAQVWLNGVNTGKVTPETLDTLTAGNYQVTLKLETYSDSTVTATVTNAQTTTVNVTLALKDVLMFGPIKLWETVGTTSSQPSGLDLSTGIAYGVSSTDKDKVDIYYSSSGFVIASASLGSGMTRQTFFKLGSSNNLTNGEDSPTKDGTWVTSLQDVVNNYFYLYDNDQHYSKMIIVNRGGGTIGNPAWVEVKFLYNKAVGDKRF